MPHQSSLLRVGSAGAVALLALAGCGGSGRSAAPTTTRAPAAEQAAHPTTTTTPPHPLAITYASAACRSLVSFAAYLSSVPEDGPDAAGEIGGMVVDAGQAVSLSHGAARWRRLEARFSAFEAYAGSARWPGNHEALNSADYRAAHDACRTLG